MENNNKIKAIIYARVSSKEQEETGYSLESQIKLLKDYAEQKNFELKEIYRVTESASGKQIRKTFMEMIDFVIKENVSVILCEKIDRLTRNLKDASTANDWILDGQNREIHFVKENFIVSKNTKAHENLVWDMKVAVARFYTNNLSEEVKKGQKEKISQGWLPTKPPLGYKTIGDKGHKIHIIDENISPYIKKMFELYATGNYSTVSLRDKMYELGLRSRGGFKVVKSKIHKLLSNPFYCGKIFWNGKEYEGKHEPIISKDLFDVVKTKLTRRYGYSYQNRHEKEFKGKVFCNCCKKTVNWECQRGHWYGGCKQCKAPLSINKKYIRQEDLEDPLLDKLVDISPKNQKVLEVLKKALKESHSEEIIYHETQVKNINAGLERIRQRLKTMYDDKLDGRIENDFYDEKVKEFTKEREILTESLKKVNSDNTEYYKIGFSIHQLSLKAKDIYLSQKATVEERRALLSYAFDKIYILNGIVTPEYSKPFIFLSKWMPKINKILEQSKKIEEIIINKDDFASMVSDLSLNQNSSKNDSRTLKKPFVERQNSNLLVDFNLLLRG